MRTRIFAGAAMLLAVTACSQPAPSPEAGASEPAAMAASEVPGGLAIDGKPNAGVFEVTNLAGKKFTTTVTADGKMSRVADGKTITGTWTSTGPGNYCETIEGKTSCFKEEMIDGVYTSTSMDDPKDVTTIKRMS